MFRRPRTPAPLTKRAPLGGDSETCPSERLERGAFPQYWLFPANPRCRAVNRKDREFVVRLFGSPNRIRTDSLLVNRANLSYFATLSDSEQNCLACAGNQSDECDRRGHYRARGSHENETGSYFTGSRSTRRRSLTLSESIGWRGRASLTPCSEDISVSRPRGFSRTGTTSPRM
jgi:hypothetical protein